MKLATLNDGTRDGRLLLVSRDLTRAVSAADLAPTLQAAIDHWSSVEHALQCRYDALNRGNLKGAFDFDAGKVMAPLPRAWQWLDGSCFLSHSELMQRAFNLDPIEGVAHTPLMYQGAGDDFLGPRQDISLPSEAHGIDFEGEFAVLVDAVPMGCTAEQARQHIRLLLQVNDVSLRALAPREMRTGFGFVQAKSSSSFAPVAVSPDELGASWRDARVHLPLQVEWNGEWFGHPHGGDMHFGFDQLIAHAALTRRLSAGTLIGSGTVSNRDRSVGSACISERRAIEMIEQGAPRTGFMGFGDRIRMEARCADGSALFGALDQRVVQEVTPCE
ncbi:MULTISPECIES: fumarylacetoacetate hydrolase family protein [Pseudomonas]|uniref:fumarylacetoacetate hydrolase family protein n=1 Tax=Pseudomonas TaxID=286 RepID=UPI000D97896E|nr:MULTISPECIES: fumarylacetoacetate hydrolase family protein [Pseudomonas]MBH3384624.1 fumarylacetoacetate hydrolase family protein [Pseudomonas juntendi]MBR7521483.1 fumarylacetoacetate hydrolase family protein [Pseudomonas juntendi]PYB96710.1 fumarylacetoacetate hydrolase [Pseudomonas sp. MB-090624]WBM31627.1 fumarylacetoacetate hydrolase family protein [Pseudomonas sp. NY11382]